MLHSIYIFRVADLADMHLSHRTGRTPFSYPCNVPKFDNLPQYATRSKNPHPDGTYLIRQLLLHDPLRLLTLRDARAGITYRLEK